MILWLILIGLWLALHLGHLVISYRACCILSTFLYIVWVKMSHIPVVCIHNNLQDIISRSLQFSRKAGRRHFWVDPSYVRHYHFLHNDRVSQSSSKHASNPLAACFVYPFWSWSWTTDSKDLLSNALWMSKKKKLKVTIFCFFCDSI